MTITVEQLKKLAENLDSLELFAKITATTIDDTLIRILKMVSGNDTSLAMLVKFLNWSGLFGSTGGDDAKLAEPPLPSELEDVRIECIELRHAIASCDC